jgi:peptidoglycan/LPS O-acetylase OafA/YrhL
MPRPVRSDQKYLPGLDGLRALAVTAVIAYHLGYGWAQGGLLGVGVFFTLSGYLITDILVGQFAASGRVKLGDFWLRRARRLLPALFVMLAVVTVWVNAFNRAFVPGYRGDVVASGLYVNNWWYIFQHDSYYSRFAPPAPLDHLWSLAVEEQFYLVWPWVVLLMVLIAGWLMKRRRVRLLGPGVHVGGTTDGAFTAAGTSTSGTLTSGTSTSAAATAKAGGSDFLSRRARWAMAGVALVLAAASAIEMAMLYHPGYDPTRIYEGTDTRAFGLLIGAAVAMVWPTRQGGRTLSVGPRRVLDAAGLAGLVVVVLLVWRTNQYSAFMFQGGLEALSVATALVVAAVATPGGLLGRALGWTPMRWIGVRSYGIYLWHYPIIVLTAAAGTVGTPVSAVRAVVLCSATVVIAALSWRFVEEPIRRGSYRRTAPAAAPGAVRAAGGAASPAGAVGGGHVAVIAGAAGDGATADGVVDGGAADNGGNTAGQGAARELVGAGVGAGGGGGPAGGGRRLGVLTSPLAIGGLCLLATAGITAGVTSSNAGQASNAADTAAAGSAGTAGAAGAGGAALAQSAAAGAATANQSGTSATARSASMTSAGGSGSQAATSKVAVTSSGASPTTPGTGGYTIQPVVGGPPTTLATGAATVAALPTPPPRTSCTSVVHIGDSTSDGLFSSDYLPNKAQQIPAQYADVGVKTTIDKVVGATSVVESLPGTPNAAKMASQVLKTGYHGCWVIALGTNDTADVAVGSEVSRVARIKQMMGLIGNQPVMWVEVKSLLTSGPYAEPNMKLWNQALQQALPSYPDMRLYNWPAVVQNSWYINDGIHFTSVGYAHRGQMIAEALAEAFPAN